MDGFIMTDIIDDTKMRYRGSYSIFNVTRKHAGGWLTLALKDGVWQEFTKRILATNSGLPCLRVYIKAKLALEFKPTKPQVMDNHDLFDTTEFAPVVLESREVIATGDIDIYEILLETVNGSQKAITENELDSIKKVATEVLEQTLLHSAYAKVKVFETIDMPILT